MKSQDEIERIARLVDNMLQDAAGDMAYSEMNFGMNPKWENRIAEMHVDNVQDIQGALADDMYDDPDLLSDMSGDRIFDEANGSYVEMIRIAMAIREFVHPPFRKAMSAHIQRWREFAAKQVANMPPDEIQFLHRLNFMDEYSKLIFGATYSQACEGEFCLHCSKKMTGNRMLQEFLKTGICGPCLIKLHVKGGE